MSKNAKLHPNNRFKDSYNFDILCKVNPKLSYFIIKNKAGLPSIDFSNPKAVKELNTALLFTYNLNFWDFPDSNLCPPIPGRLDYILYLKDLIGEQKNVSVLDIGTGATLIYPLLGYSEFKWHFVGTDVNSKSLKNASKIIAKNSLENSIELRLQRNEAHILKDILNDDDHFDLAMCNPPFYKSMEEANANNSKKNTNLNTKQVRNFSGKENELVYKGGEKAFLHSYLYESSLFPKNVKWYTSLVSQKENVKSLQSSFKKLRVKEHKVIPMQSGNKISRIVAWKF